MSVMYLNFALQAVYVVVARYTSQFVLPWLLSASILINSELCTTDNLPEVLPKQIIVFVGSPD